MLGKRLLHPSLKTRITAIALALFLVGIWSVALYATQMLRHDMIRLLGEQQYSVVSMVASQIQDELTLRTRSLEVIAADITPDLLQQPEELQSLLEGRKVLQSLFNAGTRVNNINADVLASVPLTPERMAANYADRDYMNIALKEGRTGIGRPVIGRVLKKPVMSIATPIRDKSGRIIGTLAGSMTLSESDFFDRIVNSTFGKSGGYLVISPEHELIVLGSDPSRLMSPVPKPGANAMHDRYMAGFEGYGVAVNSRGIEELSAARRIPVANWFVVNVLPTSEAFAPIAAMQERIVTITIILSILAGALAWLLLSRLLKQQLAPIMQAKRQLADMSHRDELPSPLPIERHDEIGELIEGFNLMLNGIGEREIALRQSEDKLRAILDNVDAYIYVKDTDGRFVFVNQALCRLFKKPFEQIVGQTDEIFFDADTVERIRAVDRRVLCDGEILRGEESAFRDHGGQVSHFHFAKLPLRRDNGSIYALCGISVDISERKRFEQMLEDSRNHLEEEVGRRTEELAAAKNAAEAANIAKSAFLANMSHEIRTPLNAITGMAHLIRRSGLPPDQAERLGKLEAAGHHLLDIVNAILDLSKIEAGKFTIESAAVHIEGIVGNVASMLEERAKAKGIVLYREIESIPPNLLGDGPRIQQALLNYAANAIKFTASGKVILRVRCCEENEESALLRFEVEDTGIGIAEADQARLFSAFEQADNTITRRYGGTGLGLAITQKLATLMGGEAGFHSAVGVGSVFWFTIHLKKHHSATVHRPDSVTDPAAKLREEHAGQRVLVCEDEPINQEIAREFLSDAGLIVDVADDGETAITMVQKTPYALVLMDMQMPGIGGLEATRQMRTLENGKSLPILAMTANAFAEDKARCFDAGMNDFISKPVDPDNLYGILLRWLPTRYH